MKYYKLKYRLSITHSADNNEELKHNHVLEGEIFAEPSAGNFVEFSDMEDMVNETLKIYQNQYLNSLEEFAGDANMDKVAVRMSTGSHPHFVGVFHSFPKLPRYIK